MEGTPRALVLDSGAKVCPARAYTCDRMKESGGVSQQEKNISKLGRKSSSGGETGGRGGNRRLMNLNTKKKCKKGMFFWVHRPLGFRLTRLKETTLQTETSCFSNKAHSDKNGFILLRCSFSSH